MLHHSVRWFATFSPWAALIILGAPFPAAAQLVAVQPFAGTYGGGLIDGIINIINALLVIAAIAAVVYIIISGVRYFASQGDEQAAEQAKLALIYGIIGILIVILSIVIIKFFQSQIA